MTAVRGALKLLAFACALAGTLSWLHRDGAALYAAASDLADASWEYLGLDAYLGFVHAPALLSWARLWGSEPVVEPVSAPVKLALLLLLPLQLLSLLSLTLAGCRRRRRRSTTPSESVSAASVAGSADGLASRGAFSDAPTTPYMAHARPSPSVTPMPIQSLVTPNVVSRTALPSSRSSCARRQSRPTSRPSAKLDTSLRMRSR